MRIFILTLCLLGTAVIFSGCASTTVNSVERARPEAAPSFVDSRKVVTDSSLGKSIQIRRVVEGTVSGNLLKIQVEILNTSKKVKRFSYQFEWIDANGMLVESPVGGWKPYVIQGLDTGTLNAVAPKPSVVDFRLKLIEPKAG